MGSKSVLLEHNVPVYEALEKMLQEHGKAIIVSAQGTGKSFLAQEYLNKHDYNALVICPKRSICTQWEKLSDRVTVITYQKLCRGVSIDGYDCYIFDEAHHCGSSIWGRATKQLMDSTDKPVIGLTADSVRYLDGARDVAFDVWDGCVVYGSTPQEAIEAGILPSATYVYALFDAGEKVKKYRGLPVSKSLMARLDYSLQNCASITDILRRHMPSGVRKGVVFVDAIETIKDGAKLIQETFPGVSVATIHNKLPKEANARNLDDFIRAKAGYIVVVDMLNEGVHVPGVNTIIMLRKTSSPNVFMQQLGRGLAAGADDIIVYDFVGNNCSLKMIGERVEGAKKVVGAPKTIHHSNQVIIHDYASEVLSILKDIEQFCNGRWSPEEEDILRKYYPIEGPNVYKRLPERTTLACSLKAHKLNLARHRTRWTSKEDSILKQYYQTEGSKVASRIPGKSKASCIDRALCLGITFNGIAHKWSSNEFDILKKYYPLEGVAVTYRLPGRSEKACQQMARNLNLQKPDNKRKPWTQEEDEIIRKYYPQEGTNVTKRLPGRTSDACVREAHLLGVSYSWSNWSPEEDAILREFYPVEGGKVECRLPGKTNKKCVKRANKLNIAYVGRSWSADEDAILQKYYPLEGSSVARRLPNRTDKACITRANSLGLLSALCRASKPKIQASQGQ